MSQVTEYLFYFDQLCSQPQPGYRLAPRSIPAPDKLVLGLLGVQVRFPLRSLARGPPILWNPDVCFPPPLTPWRLRQGRMLTSHQEDGRRGEQRSAICIVGPKVAGTGQRRALVGLGPQIAPGSAPRKEETWDARQTPPSPAGHIESPGNFQSRWTTGHILLIPLDEKPK